MLTLRNKKAQVTIFVIIAIIIIAAVLLLFVFKKPLNIEMQTDIQKAETSFLDCVSLKAKDAIGIAGMQGGWIKLPDFDPGSQFMPFSNYFSFLGTQIPYWFYVSGNNIQKFQFPPKYEIENQISSWLEQEIQSCKPESQEYQVEFSGDPKVGTTIRNSEVALKISWSMQVKRADKVTIKTEHSLNVKSSFGSLYNDAIKILANENSTTFLENYTLDIINNYAPTTKVELSCTPKIWQKDQVETEIQNALESNIPMIKFNGNYYSLTEKQHNYFVTDLPINNEANLLYSKNWPIKLEVWPSENNILRADPIGTQTGLGILGFCYVAYHFVYDLDFPVLIQVSHNTEILQFPLLVVIDKNVARAASTEESPINTEDICNPKTQTATFITADQDINPVESEIYLSCVDHLCYLGNSTIQEGIAKLETKVPACLNGQIISKSPGYEETNTIISTNQPFTLNLFLNKLYELGINLDLQGNERAIINFESNGKRTTLSYPEQNKIQLAAGIYNISVQLFKEANINLPSQTGEKCVSIPNQGLEGQQTQCFDLSVPSQTLTEVIFGGGSSQIELTEQQLSKSMSMKISPEKFELPTTIEKLGEIYEIVDTAKLQISLS